MELRKLYTAIEETFGEMGRVADEPLRKVAGRPQMPKKNFHLGPKIRIDTVGFCHPTKWRRPTRIQ